MASPTRFSPTNSSAVDHLDYHAETGDLTVHYKGGKRYTFHDVAADHFDRVQAEDADPEGSVGRYLNAHIKGKHQHTKHEE